MSYPLQNKPFVFIARQHAICIHSAIFLWYFCLTVQCQYCAYIIIIIIIIIIMKSYTKYKKQTFKQSTHRDGPKQLTN